jgi:hypothetical protein
MAEKNSTAVIVALITVAGVIAAAIISRPANTTPEISPSNHQPTNTENPVAPPAPKAPSITRGSLDFNINPTCDLDVSNGINNNFRDADISFDRGTGNLSPLNGAKFQIMQTATFEPQPTRILKMQQQQILRIS